MNPDAGASIVGLLLARSEAGEPVRLYVALAPPLQQQGAPTCALVRDFAIGGHDGANLEFTSGRSRLMVHSQLRPPDGMNERVPYTAAALLAMAKANLFSDFFCFLERLRC